MFEGLSGVTAGSTSAGSMPVRAVSSETTPGPRPSDVAREYELSKKLGAEIHELIDRVEIRVQHVQIILPPAAAGDEAGRPAASTDLARAMQETNGTLINAVRRLQRLVESIDL